MVTKRGRVLRDTNVGPGIVTVDAKQYTFTLEQMWLSDVPPRPGMVVDVAFDDAGAPSAVQAVPDSQLAREQAQQTLAGARRHGASLTGSLRSRFGLPVILTEALLLISFFMLPNLKMGNGFMERSLSGWDTIGLDPATMATSSHGILSLLALALFAPIAVPFLQKAWSRWLYAAPFAFAVIAFASLSYEIENVGRAARQAVGGAFGAEAARGMGNPLAGLFSPAVGAFLVLICSIFLLTRAFRHIATPAAQPSLS